MTDKKRIADNESVAEMLRLIEGASAIEGLWQAFPLLQQAFPQLSGFSEKLTELKEQSKILLLLDRFNELFASSGWISYDSMNRDVMRKAIETFEAHGLEVAEDYLVSTFDSDTLKWSILRFNGHPEFKKRIRLVELARRPAYSTVAIRATFSAEHDVFEEDLKVSAGYQDEKGLPMCRLDFGGKWTLVQNSFRSVIYRNVQSGKQLITQKMESR